MNGSSHSLSKTNPHPVANVLQRARRSRAARQRNAPFPHLPVTALR